jgi:hypothetical protein
MGKGEVVVVVEKASQHRSGRPPRFNRPSRRRARSRALSCWWGSWLLHRSTPPACSSVFTATTTHTSTLLRKGLQTFRETRSEAKVLSFHDFWLFRLR